MRLFAANATVFTGLGLGLLHEALSATVTEKRNGEYELEFTYPMDGVRYADLDTRMIVMAKPNPYDAEQPFRIYKIQKPLDGICTVLAHHISYDLAGIPCSPFTASNVASALAGLVSNAAIACPFTFWTDKTNEAAYKVRVPTSIQSAMFGSEGSIIDTFRGEWEFDGWTCKLHNARGSDNNVVIRYGKNLTDIDEHKLIESWATGIYPFWTDQDGHLVTLNEKIVWASDDRIVDRVFAVDFSDKFTPEDLPTDSNGIKMPTQDQLREKAVKYIENNDLDTPYLSLSIDFVALDQTEEYKDFALLEGVKLCDTVTVEYPKLRVSATAKVTETTYDVLLGRYTEVKVGTVTTGLADTIASADEKMKTAVQDAKSSMQAAIDSATGMITGNGGTGNVIWHVNNDGIPYEILIMNTSSIDTATKVWRWNVDGLGFSSTGYAGPYRQALTADGKFVADFIQTGSINASLITTGHLDAQLIQVNGNDLQDFFNVQEEDGVITLTLSTLGNFQVKITGTGIGFYVSGKRISYWDGRRFVIENLDFMQFGQSCKMVMQENKSISFTGV